jgi:hypothetical protein
VRAVLDAFTVGGLDTRPSHGDENVLYHGCSGEEWRGREGARAVTPMYSEAFPDGKIVEEWEIFDRADVGSRLGG